MKKFGIPVQKNVGFWRKPSLSYLLEECVSSCYQQLPSNTSDILICDEANYTALDVTTGSYISELFKIIAERIPLYSYVYHCMTWVLFASVPIK